MLKTHRRDRLFGESIKRRRIVDEHPFPNLGIGRPVGEQVTKVAVVGHWLGDHDMRPVGAPEHTIRRRFDERPREVDDVAVGQAARGYAVRRGKLDPAPARRGQPKQGPEPGAAIFDHLNSQYNIIG